MKTCDAVVTGLLTFGEDGLTLVLRIGEMYPPVMDGPCNEAAVTDGKSNRNKLTTMNNFLFGVVMRQEQFCKPLLEYNL